MFQLNIRFITKMLGIMLIIETVFMLLAALVAFLYEGGDARPIVISSGITFVFGLLFYILGYKANEHAAGRREGMLTVALVWVLFSLFGLLPYYIGGYIPSFTDAFFETMSGFTTTGSTILSDIESLPYGILFWRSLTQWQGGIGMVVFTVALLPLFGVGATQLYDAETSGITHERFRPRVTQVAKRLWGIYLFLTLLLMGLLWMGPMGFFDAMNHALTCMSTGGYSTKNISIAYWNSSYIDYVLTIFMFLGATNFTLIFFFFKGDFKRLFRDEEFRWFFFLVSGATAIITCWLYIKEFESSILEAFRKAVFQVVSLVSTTGFATADYNPWGAFVWFIILILMVICGCAGSTCGGLKMGRFVILSKSIASEFQKQTHPHAVIPVRINGHAVTGHVVNRVLAFASIYFVLLILGCLLLSLDGMPFPEAIGSAVTSIGNVGPGLGAVGPIHNFSEIPDLSKWVMSFLMMTGRLELFTVLTLFLPGFWRQ